MTPSTWHVPLLCAILSPLSLSGLLCRPCPTPQLDVTATVNTRPGASTPPVRAGDPLVVDYLLHNGGDTRLVAVRVTAPDALGGAVSCAGGGSSVVLRRGASVDCLVRLTAESGTHAGTVTVTARTDDDSADDADEDDADDDDQQISVSAAVGYQGISSSMAVTDRVSVKPDASGGAVTLTSVVTNTGSAPLFDFAAADAVPGSGVSCPQPSSGLAPGAALTCTGTTHLASGTYRSVLTASADDRTTTVGAGGQPVPPPKVTANAAADFTVVALPPPPSPTPTPTPPPSPQPTPSPTPHPSPPPTPPPSPSPTPPAPTGSPPSPPTTSPPTTSPPPSQPPRTTPPPPPAATPSTTPPPKKEAATLPSRPGLKTPLFLLVMMMPAAGAAAVLAARRK